MYSIYANLYADDSDDDSVSDYIVSYKHPNNYETIHEAMHIYNVWLPNKDDIKKDVMAHAKAYPHSKIDLEIGIWDDAIDECVEYTNCTVYEEGQYLAPENARF